MLFGATYLLNRPSSLREVKELLKMPAENAIEEELTQEQKEILAAKKDRKHFAPLYERYHEAIFRYVNKRVADKETCFDLTSQVFLKAMTGLDKYEDRGFPFSSWLYRLAYTTVVDYFRETKQGRERSIDIRSEDIESISEEMDTSIPEETFELLFEELENMKEQDLLLVEMRFFEKRSFKEIAEIVNITENNAKVKVYRLLDKLKQKIHRHA